MNLYEEFVAAHPELEGPSSNPPVKPDVDKFLVWLAAERERTHEPRYADADEVQIAGQSMGLSDYEIDKLLEAAGSWF